jgi:hypothetical protein
MAVAQEWPSHFCVKTFKNNIHQVRSSISCMPSLKSLFILRYFLMLNCLSTVSILSPLEERDKRQATMEAVTVEHHVVTRSALRVTSFRLS